MSVTTEAGLLQHFALLCSFVVVVVFVVFARIISFKLGLNACVGMLTCGRFCYICQATRLMARKCFDEDYVCV